ESAEDVRGSQPATFVILSPDSIPTANEIRQISNSPGWNAARTDPTNEERIRMNTVKVRAGGGLILILLGVGAGAPTVASAQTLTTLHSFPAAPGDGTELHGGLIADAAGNLYGTTFGGGSGNGYGTVFKLTPAGTESVLHSFSGDDGAGPGATLIADAAGNLYGTTKYGGLN